MKNESERSRKISINGITVAPSKIFTYPTRLADCWKAGIMEINLPAYQLDSREIEVTVRQGSTQSLGIKNRNIFKRIYKNGEIVSADDSLDYGANFVHMLGFDSPAMQELEALCHYPYVRI